MLPSFLRARGRGRFYSPFRGFVESVLRVAYVRDWPGRAWGRVPRSNRVDRIDVRVELRGVARERRIAFASDLHIGPTTAARTLDRAFEQLAAIDADVVAFGGDFVFLDATRRRVAELEARIRALAAPVKVAVFGNHDLWTDHDAIERALHRAGVRLLVNESIRVGEIAIVGLDDPWTGRFDAGSALGSCHDARVRVGVAHAPEALPAVVDRVDVLLCGHTHGGHVALPGGRPLIVPGRVGARHPHGVHQVSSTVLVVSRGVGGIELPIRAFAPPDVIALTLAPARPPG